MLAAVTYQNGQTEIVSRANPEILPGFVAIRVAAAGICGTDRHIVHGAYPAQFPRVLGHEITGVVEMSESAVISPGQAVVIDPNIPCYACDMCHRGEVHLCRHRQAVGVDMDGGFQEVLVVPEEQVYVLDPSVPIERGIFAEPLSCCLHGVDRLGLKAGARVAIVGLGPIGMLLSFLLSAQGSKIVGIEENRERCEIARHNGLNVFSPKDMEDQGTSQFDAIVDAAGSAKVLEWALTKVRVGGSIMVFGVAHPQDMAYISPYILYQKEITLVGAYTNPFTMSRAVDLINAHKIDLVSMMTERISFSDIPQALQRSPKGFKTFVVL